MEAKAVRAQGRNELFVGNKSEPEHAGEVIPSPAEQQNPWTGLPILLVMFPESIHLGMKDSALLTLINPLN